MGDIVNFPARVHDPLDDTVMCSVTVNGRGEIDLILNEYVDTVEQHDWLIVKLSAAVSRLLDRRAERL